MREIIFRGKRKDNGEWVYGSLQCFKGFSIFDMTLKNFVPVDSKTIGRYTGLTDENGKKIFEGDIVKRRHIVYDFSGEGHVHCRIADVKYDKAFFYPRNLILDSKSVIIGNIHDNPELLEVSENE